MILFKKRRGNGLNSTGCYWWFFIIIIVAIIFTGALQFLPASLFDEDFLNLNDNARVIYADSPLSPTQSHCLHITCFDVYKCGKLKENHLSVYIYPKKKFTDENNVPISLPMSKEFIEIVETIRNSPFYTADPLKACLLLPYLDLLNENHLRLKLNGQALRSLEFWNNGSNHLLFNMLMGSVPDYNSTLDVSHGQAILAGASFSSFSYRRGFHVSIPIFNPLLEEFHSSALVSRQWLVVSSQVNIHQEFRDQLDDFDSNLMLLLEGCKNGNYSVRCKNDQIIPYPQILEESEFCLVIRAARLGQIAFSDVMQASCIPVVVADGYILPFSEVLDWKLASVKVLEDDLPKLLDVLQKISSRERILMRKYVRHFWKSYMHSIATITLTTLHIISERVFPHMAHSYNHWNRPHHSESYSFQQLQASQSSGFTALILTYDRMESLFKIINQISDCPNLAKILVIWNNQVKSPPPAKRWPKTLKPLKVIQTQGNKLSNRFYPYDEIETDAILSLDDDILMLTVDEIEFGYQVWKEHPDRLVGFPSRLHVWNNVSQMWRYESEWTSSISIVLTGAAFFHKFYSFQYTNNLPGNIKNWVDDQINCEDIAMNFLISNISNKAPIKVTARQKFKCPECPNQAMLSADKGHIMERSQCVNTFYRTFGGMPLQPIQFRADPLLYKELLPDEAKAFRDIGSL